MNWYGIAVDCRESDVHKIYEMYREWAHVRMSAPHRGTTTENVIEFISFQPFNLDMDSGDDKFQACIVAQLEPLPRIDARDVLEAVL